MSAAAILALAGCGGQSDQSAIRDTVNHFTVDIGQGNWQAACPLTTGQLHATCEQLVASGGPPTAAQCSQVSPDSQAGQACAASQSTTAALSSYTSLAISKVVVSGSSATVAFSGSQQTLSVQKVGGKWLVAG